MASNYIVKVGESIGDVVMNTTGSINNWDVILTANGFDSWVPELQAGQAILIPDNVVIDQNTKRQLDSYPAANNTVNDVFQQIDNLVNQLADNWILATGFWNDAALWIDSKLWID